MTDWAAHRLWLSLLAIAVIIGAANAPLIGMATRAERTKLENLRSQSQKETDALRQLQDDLDATENLKTQIDDSDADRSLQSVNRLRVAKMLETRAAESRLTSFTYSLSPEKPTEFDTIGAGKQTLATSDVAMTADAPTDIDVYRFVENIRLSLPGRLALRHLSMERAAQPNAPIAATNLHVKIDAEWLSNGAAPNPDRQAKP
jgi:hypothetical protein